MMSSTTLALWKTRHKKKTMYENIFGHMDVVNTVESEKRLETFS